jgi:uncharacterized protein YecE (DUF72 family)
LDFAAKNDRTDVDIDPIKVASVVATDDEVDQAFAHLEELLERLPEIQEKDTRLTTAREARELLELQERSTRLTTEIAEYESIRDKALRDAKAASDAGDAQLEGQSLALLRMYSDLHMTRLAPMQRAQNALWEMLEQSSLSSDDPLADLALSEQEYTALEEELRAYQLDYQKTYEFCEKAEAGQ